jgi:FkbM family methyltransferase
MGAHLGYYTIELSRRAGNSGKVIAIEPVTKFFYTLKDLLKKKNIRNVQVEQVALGGKGEYVEMGIPKVNNMKKFGYARVMQSNMGLEYVESERVKNEHGDHFFANLPRLDFVKCDVEGLEVPVFASMIKTVAKYLPVLLCELADKDERIKLHEMLSPLGYEVFFLENKRLHPLNVYSDKRPISHNHYFIPSVHRQRLKELIVL